MKKLETKKTQFTKPSNVLPDVSFGALTNVSNSLLRTLIFRSLYTTQCSAKPPGTHSAL